MITEDYLARRQASGSPIQVAVVGAGFMASGLVRHISQAVSGMRVAVICNRTPSHASLAWQASGVARDPAVAVDETALDALVAAGVPAISDRIDVLVRSARIDVLVDATGALEFGARVAFAALEAAKPLVSMNAEVDATVGPILDRYAADRGVVRSIADGDQPAVQLRLASFARSLGLTPRLLGNIKGLHDVHRTPTTQAAFATKWKQNVNMVTSFADGTKVSFEQAVVANALGLSVHCTGMRAGEFPGHVDDLVHAYDLDELRDLGGAVDFVVGAYPAPGVFCLAEVDDPAQAAYLRLFKLGPGPLYALYTPYHLCHLEAPRTIATVVGFGVGIGAARNGPTVEVCAVAKQELGAGSVLDGCGGYLTYGTAMSRSAFLAGRHLPMGVAEGCTLRADLPAGHLLTYDDVILPPGRLIDRLRSEQDLVWPSP